MIRNCFVREEDDRLILGSGLPAGWLDGNADLQFGPAPTAFGTITVSIRSRHETVIVDWQTRWHRKAPIIEVRLPGQAPVIAAGGATSVVLEPVSAS